MYDLTQQRIEENAGTRAVILNAEHASPEGNRGLTAIAIGICHRLHNLQISGIFKCER